MSQATSKPNCIDYIELPAPSPDLLIRARDFHSAVFGWQYQMWGNEYCDTSSSGVNSGISVEGAESTVRAPLPVVYTDDLAADEARVREAGGTITREVFSFPGGKRFHFRDPANNELAVWSDR